MKVFSITSVAAAAAIVLSFMLLGNASAHAKYASSTPAKGAVVTTAPTSVAITFGEDIQSTAGSYGIAVTDASNASAATGPATTDASDAKKLSVPLKSGLANGRYVVRWNNTSADDGDPLSGAFSFYIGTQPTPADLAADQQLDAVEANQLATATAEAAGAETPAAAATPAAVATPATSATRTSGGAALPATGDGGSGTSSWPAIALLAIGVIAAGSSVLVLAGARVRRGR